MAVVPAIENGAARGISGAGIARRRKSLAFRPDRQYARRVTAPFLYMVRVWVSPEGGQRYLDWLEKKHMAEVIAEPGFLWARRCRLDQGDERGWHGYLLIYALESRAALEAYLASSARERFWRELVPFDDVHRAERFHGAIDFALDKAR